MKRKSNVVKKPTLDSCGDHDFSESDVRSFRSKLLPWYEKNARTLPWRERSKVEENGNIRGYAVLVSEIMLQQTQVGLNPREHR